MTTNSQELLLERAYHWESTTPDKTYLTQPVTPTEVWNLSWAESMRQARSMAAHLRGLGLPPKTNIAIFGKNSAHWILADLAIWMAGHVSVPLYATLLSDTVKLILKHSECKLMFVGKLDVWDEAIKGVPKNLPLISLPLAPENSGVKWEQIVAETPPITDNPTREPEDLATIVYTSGTTGVPKGVMLNFEAMGVAPHLIAKIRAADTNSRMISYLPLAHCFERCFVESLSLCHGFQVFFARELDSFIEDLQRAHPTIFVSVPRLWVKFQSGVLAKVPQEKLDRLLKIPVLGWIVRRKVLKGLGLQDVVSAGSGAAPLPPEVIDWYRKLGLNLSEGYGMSENFAYSHIAPDQKIKLGTVGTSAPGVETKIGEGGEILVKSPTNMMGYYKEKKLTKEAFTSDGFLRTGDVGAIDSEGYLRITGRLKEQFKTAKGKYVAPAPIETKLMANRMVEQACVTGVGLPQPLALITLSEEAHNEIKNGGKNQVNDAITALLKELNGKAEHHEQLQFIMIAKGEWAIENKFLTPTMKIKRNVIEETYGGQFEKWYESNQPVIWES